MLMMLCGMGFVLDQKANISPPCLLSSLLFKYQLLSWISLEMLWCSLPTEGTFILLYVCLERHDHKAPCPSAWLITKFEPKLSASQCLYKLLDLSNKQTCKNSPPSYCPSCAHLRSSTKPNNASTKCFVPEHRLSEATLCWIDGIPSPTKQRWTGVWEELGTQCWSPGWVERRGLRPQLCGR